MVKSRSPMQIDQDFERRVKEIQKQIMMKRGEKLSLREITKRVCKYPEWADIENKILNNADQIELKINFDRRKKQ